MISTTPVNAALGTVLAAGANGGQDVPAFLDALKQLNEYIDAEKTKLLFEVKEKQDELQAERQEEERKKKTDELLAKISALRSAMQVDRDPALEGQLSMLLNELVMMTAFGG